MVSGRLLPWSSVSVSWRWRLYAELGMKSSPTISMLAFGVPASLLGPVGTFALARYEQIDAW
jgi:hypothetical protein